jgi:hypothetical protein
MTNALIKHPQLDRTCAVMPKILRACLKRPRTYDYLERATGAPRDSLHVLCMRLRNRGLLVATDPGTPDVKHATTRAGAQGWPEG